MSENFKQTEQEFIDSILARHDEMTIKKDSNGKKVVRKPAPKKEQSLTTKIGIGFLKSSLVVVMLLPAIFGLIFIVSFQNFKKNYSTFFDFLNSGLVKGDSNTSQGQLVNQLLFLDHNQQTIVIALFGITLFLGILYIVIATVINKQRRKNNG